jgi:chitin synthase
MYISVISADLKLSSTSVYLIGMAAIFLITALLHLTEFWIIFYGFVYLLGLPSGYLILMIYSICNITDSSWGEKILSVLNHF